MSLVALILPTAPLCLSWTYGPLQRGCLLCLLLLPHPPSYHPLFRSPGASLFAVAVDVMHTMDLGVYAELAGSLLWTFVYDGEFPGNAEARLDVVWERVRHLYEEWSVKVRLTNLTL